MKKIMTILFAMSLVLFTAALFANNEHPSQCITLNSHNQIQDETRDYGWVEQASGFSETSRGINFMNVVDENIVWATAYDGSGGGGSVHEFTRTVNGGELWVAGEIDVTDPNLEPAMVFALDDQKAWCPMHSGSPGGIYHTSDGGENWARQGHASMYTNPVSFANVVHFWNENDGFAQGDPVGGYYELYTTTDGGENWTRVPQANIPAPINGEFGIVGYYDVVGETIWWGTNKGRVFKSTDMGYNWTVCNPVGSLTYVTIWFKDSMNGLLQDKGAGTTGTLYETSDGGETWTFLNYNGSCYTNDMSYVPGTDNMYVSTGAAAGVSGASYSLDGGANWTIYDGTEGTQFLATDWANDECGYAGGFTLDQFTGGMFKYTYVSAPVLPPEDLYAEALADLTVQLFWSPPPSGSEGWIRWDNGENAGSLGLTNPGEWDAASKFSATDMLPYADGEITKIKFYPTSETAIYSVCIWTGANASLVLEQDVPSPTINDWNEIDLDVSVTVESGTIYWIGYHMNQVDSGQPNGYPAGYDAGPAQNGLWANLGSGFQDISTQGFDYNWNTAAYIENSDGEIAQIQNNASRSRDLTEYNIFHSLESGGPYDIVATVPAADTSYIHPDPETGATNYYVVTAVYGMDESDYTNEASAYVEIATAEEIIYDDDSAETGYNSGTMGDRLAVRMTPDTYPVSLLRVKLYLTQVQQTVALAIWDDDGPDGKPGTQIVETIAVSTSSIQANSWTVVTIPEGDRPTIYSGDFYVGWIETGAENLIGVDENGTAYNRSWQYTSGQWFDYTMGVPQNMMMRAVVNTDVGVNEPNPQNLNSIYNFPNPVTSTTTFKYNIQSAPQEPVEINIYNILGQRVDSVTGENGIAVWNPTNIPNGLYFYKIKTENYSATKKMLLMK
ncbi:MAG: T9SS type A sorting domain-containing protein [Candidatus Cloacimonadota bacterium]|nr:T9SS type A sorting domain-containing protein [Candidatus Cloacimonadota bacterium]